MTATPRTPVGLISITLLFHGVYAIGPAQACAWIFNSGTTGESQQALFNTHKYFRRNNHR